MGVVRSKTDIFQIAKKDGKTKTPGGFTVSTDKRQIMFTENRLFGSELTHRLVMPVMILFPIAKESSSAPYSFPRKLFYAVFNKNGYGIRVHSDAIKNVTTP